jgi:hypothetical protein
VAIAAAPSHLNFTAAAPLMQFSACVLRTCVGAEKGAWCDHESDAGLAGGFRVFWGWLWLVLRGRQLPSGMLYRFLVLQPHR